MLDNVAHHVMCLIEDLRHTCLEIRFEFRRDLNCEFYLHVPNGPSNPAIRFLSRSRG